jgi:hypothetical protein
MGTPDRVIRILLAALVVLLIASRTLTGTLAIVLGILAAIFLVTSAVGFCPLYVLLRLSTRKRS